MSRRQVLVLALLLFASLWSLYLLTAATGIVPGDPTEYTFVAHLLGIAHPPGYAFMTLLTKLWQTLLPLGSIAQRSHWLAGAAGALTALLLFGAVWQISRRLTGDRTLTGLLPPLLAAFSVAAAADHWQHSIHVNPHIITVTLNALALFLLVGWWRSEGEPGSDRWLLVFCVLAGLGPTHHPLTVFSFPAYALFILLLRPGLFQLFSASWWRERRWKTLLLMLLFGLLGLAVWIYYPIRSPMQPEFGPSDMNTLDGFLNVALARGLRVNLFHFGLAEQGQRLLVFWTLLRQQFSLPVIALAPLGLAWLAKRERRLLALLGLAFLGNLVFIINTVQDVMAYLLTPFMLVALMAGLGAAALVSWVKSLARSSRLDSRQVGVLLGIGLLVWPAATLLQNLPRISLRGYEAGDDHIQAVFDRFEGQGEGATLLNDWEHMTPLWYARYVDGRWFDPADFTPSLVSTDRPWAERVFEHLPAGPVYLSGYRREIVELGFRLRPEGEFYRVVEPGDKSIPDQILPLDPIPDQPIELLGYALSDRELPAGGWLSVDLAMRAPVTPTEYLVPYLQLGNLHFPFTTDSHLLTPWWQAGEVIVERFTVALPLDQEPGRYPLSVGLTNISAGSESEPLFLEQLTVAQNPDAPSRDVLENLLANLGQRVGVERVAVRGGGERRSAVWDQPLLVRPGDELDITIQWRCLAPLEESYTVFVHLMDSANQVWDQQDYTPLGGAFPTHLWIPKWLPGQTVLDPYTLSIPPHAPSGDYYLEIGLYGMTTRQRVYLHDRDGNLVGDRLILGPVRVP